MGGAIRPLGGGAIRPLEGALSDPLRGKQKEEASQKDKSSGNAADPRAEIEQSLKDTEETCRSRRQVQKNT